jgi:hypothetical protein
LVDDFIDLAEADINAQLRSRNQEDFTSTVATAGYLVHPSDWVAHKRVSSVSGANRYDLQPFSEENGIVQLGATGSSVAQGYVVRGDKTYLLGTGSGTFEMVYYKSVPALGSSATTNWLLTNYPHIYLGMALKYAAAWGYDDGRVPGLVQAASMAIGDLNKATSKASYGQIPQMRADRVY